MFSSNDMLTSNEFDFKFWNKDLSSSDFNLFKGCIQNDIDLVNKSLKNSLFSKPANVNSYACIYKKRTGDRYYPLEVAIMYSDYAVVELLISKGAEISGGRTLEFAIIYGKGNPRIKVIQLLISHGVNVNAEFQGSGKSALLMVSEFNLKPTKKTKKLHNCLLQTARM